MKAVLCPICNGSGKIGKGIDRNSTSAVPVLETCHGCNGKGWVEVGEDKTDYIPWYPIYPTPTYPWYPNPWWLEQPYTVTWE